jgi:type IV fimbrial biogenesis protein FimT
VIQISARYSPAQQGFTLLELLITIALVGILGMMAVPSFQNLMQDTYQRTAVNDLNNMLNMARDQAINRKTITSICIANANNNGCATSGTDWSNGYMVIIENPAEILSIQEAARGSQIISAETNRIRFNTNGTVINPTNFKFCDDRGDSHMKKLSLNAGAQLRTATGTDTCE